MPTPGIPRQQLVVAWSRVSFRFSGGFSGPRKSTIGYPTSPDAMLVIQDAYARPHESTAIVSKLLAAAIKSWCRNIVTVPGHRRRAVDSRHRSATLLSG
jgi:hypothetical protein